MPESPRGDRLGLAATDMGHLSQGAFGQEDDQEQGEKGEEEIRLHATKPGEHKRGL